MADTPTEDFLSCGWNFARTYSLGEAPADTFREWMREHHDRQLPCPQRGKTWYVCAFSDADDFNPFCENSLQADGRNKSSLHANGDSEDAGVVVLGRRLLPGGVLSEELKARVAKGVAVSLAGSRRLIFSGGGGEAAAMLKHARGLGFKGEAVLEEESMNTFENAKKTASLLRYGVTSRVTIVTSSYHEARAKSLFEMALKGEVKTQSIFWPVAQSVWLGELDWATKQQESSLLLRT